MYLVVYLLTNNSIKLTNLPIDKTYMTREVLLFSYTVKLSRRMTLRGCDFYACCACRTDCQRRLPLPISIAPSAFGCAAQTSTFIAK